MLQSASAASRALRLRRPSLAAAALCLAALALPGPAQAKRIMVVGPHPDDEAITSAGRIRTAIANGDTVTVVIVTNGDIDGVATGLQRQWESVETALTLGLTEQDVVFLGFPDGSMRRIYDSPSGTQVFTSAAGQTATYGIHGLGGMDYHRYLHGVPGPYDRNTVVADFRALLSNFQPDEIYTVSHFDAHGDHEATALFLVEALVSLKRSGLALQPKLYQSIVWMFATWGVAYPWPQLSSDWTPRTPILPFSNPCVRGDCLDATQLEWNRASRFVQPPEMQILDKPSNLKARSIPGEAPGWFGSWVRRDEFFWLTDFGTNLAITAAVSASSENLGAGQGALNAVNGVVGGLPDYTADIFREWVTLGQLAGAWIELRWPSPVRVAQVTLHDRSDGANNVLSGTLTFSDGSSVPVGALPSNGAALPVTFAPRTVSWVRFTVTGAEGTAAGLSEIQVLGAPASSTANLPPHFIRGPVAAADSIPASQTTTLAATAWDLDGDPVQYQWSAENGLVLGTGPNVVFTPPAVSSPTWIAITVTALDGRGGSASNSTFVEVTPAPASSVSVSPTAVFGGDPAQGSVVLGAAAPAGGTIVPLSSGNPAIVSVPASVTVPGGGFTATFPVATSPVSSSTQVVVTASFAGGPRGAAITVAPPSLAGLSLSPSSVLGGNPSQGQVVLPLPAGSAGVLVALSSSDPAVASVPAGVTIPAGATSATFPISTSSVPSPANVTISATFGTTRSAVLSVGPLAIMTFALDPSTVVGGGTSQGTVLLNGLAPAGGAVVALSSSVPSIASVPASVTIPAFADAATFTITTTAVAAPVAVSVQAAFQGESRSMTLTVTDLVQPPPNPNLLANPEGIGGAPWHTLGGANITLSLNAATAPDGTNHATRAVTAAQAGHALRQIVTLTPGATYTFSFFARNNGGTGASLSIYDLTNGRDIVAPSPFIGQLSGTGYTRIVRTFTVPAGGSSVGIYPLRDSGAPVDALLWGAKLETGSVATPYQPLAADLLSLSPTVVASGAAAVSTVTLVGPAPAGGAAVPLSSSDPAAASVPASVTVPAGATVATFPIAAGTVPAVTTVAITAALPRGTQSASLTVNPPLLVSSLAVSPASVLGGASSQGTVTLSGPAPAGGSAVSLSSSDPAATVPATVTVPAGAASATFAVATSSVPATTAVTLTAALGPFSRTATLTVNPLTIAGLSLAPASVVAGGSSQGTVTLSGPAPAGGSAVSLGSSDPAATVPATVTVPAGAASATFGVATVTGSAATSAIVTASLGSSSRTATLSITPLQVSTVTVSPASVLAGTSSQGTVTLGAAAPASATVLLSASHPAAAVPPSVTVPAGAATATFTVTTSTVSASTPVTLTASLGSSSASTVLTVGPLAVTGLSLSPASLIGGATSQGTVTLNGPAQSGGTTVSLGSAGPAVTVPASVTVPAGSTSATFSAATAPVSASTPVLLTASLGSSSASATLAVEPLRVTGLTLSPASLVGGGTSQGAVALNGAAPAGGATVSIASADPAASAPATVGVPAGATGATFTVTTSPVSASTPVVLTASLGSSSASATLAVEPLRVAGLVLSPSSLVGGGTSQGTVTLNGAAPAGGSTVSLSSSASAVTVPATVAVPAGSTAATFTASTTVVPSQVSSTLTASLGASSAIATLSVLPNASNPNLLVDPEQIGSAAWQRLGSIAVTLNQAAAPDGSQRASRAVVTSTAGHALRQFVRLTPGATYTFSFFARNNGGTAASYSVFDSTNFANIVAPTSYFGQINSASYTRVRVTFTVPAGCTDVFVYPVRDSGGPVDLLLWGAKLETGTSATGYPY